MTKPWLIIAFLLLSSRAFAVTAEECSVLLRFGIYDEYEVISSEQKFLKTKDLYCSDSSSEFGLSMPVQAIPVQGSANFKDSMCNKSEKTQYENYYFRLVNKTINKDLVKGFNDCLEKGSPGITYLVHTQGDPKRFTINFSFKPFGSILSDTMRVIVEGATCVSADPGLPDATQDGKPFQVAVGLSELELSCRRDENSSVQITASALNSSINTRSITIPAWKEPTKSVATYHFYSPLVGDTPLDTCAKWGETCASAGIQGKPAADLWCHGIGLGNASAVTMIGNVPPTKVISSGQICNGPVCGRITEITCLDPDAS